MDIQIEVEGQ